MARLIGLFGNRGEWIERLVEHEARVLDVRGLAGREALGGWGVGFHQSGEVLIRKRPSEARSELRVAELVQGVRADSVLVHVRSRTEGGAAHEGTDNTQPFRYRSWLYAQTGSVAREFARVRVRLLESVPEFLRSQIRGESDAEVLFTLFLSFLHDAGHLEHDAISSADAVRALRSTLTLADNVLAEFGEPPARVNVLIGNGELLLAVHRGRAMAYREFSSRADIAALLAGDSERARRDPGNVHLVVVASDFQVAQPTDSSEFEAVDADAMTGWRSIEPSSLVVVQRGVSPAVEPL